MAALSARQRRRKNKERGGKREREREERRGDGRCIVGIISKITEPNRRGKVARVSRRSRFGELRRLPVIKATRGEGRETEKETFLYHNNGRQVRHSRKRAYCSTFSHTRLLRDANSSR